MKTGRFSWSVISIVFISIINSTMISTPVSASTERNFFPDIVGGVEAKKGEFPFIVSLQTKSHFCGGSLIASNVVLTAAHCIKDTYPIEEIRVKAGLHKLADKNAESFGIKDSIVNPNYNDRTHDFDYAILILNGRSSFAPISLAHEEIPLDDDHLKNPMAITAGWGTLSEGGGVSPALMKVEVPLISAPACEKSYQNISDRMICAGYPEGGKDSCQGDSGGPLLVEKDGKPSLVGIVSWGQGCARPEKYGVYSKVSAGYEWIKKILGH